MKQIYFLLLVTTLLLATAVWQDAPVGAATRLTEDLADLFKSAELVVDAEVLDRRAGPVGMEGLPLTSVSLKVNRVFKGSGVTAGETLDADYLGGSTNELQTVVPGQPELVPGTHVVVLLSKFGRTPHWRVIGGDAGEIDFPFGDDGRPLARRTCGAKFDYFVRDPQSLTGFTAISAATLNENQFQQLFEAIAATGRPVIETPDKSPTASPFTFAASEPTPTSVPARLVDGGSSASSAPPAASPVGLSLTQRLLVILALITLGWIIGQRLIASLNDLTAKRKF